MKLLRKFILKRVLSVHPVFTLLLGCILSLQTLIIISSNKQISKVPATSEPIQNLNQPRKREWVSSSDSSLQCDCMYGDIDREEALLYQAPKRQNVRLIMGVPTVNRTGDSYILSTIRSLVESMNEEEKKSVLIIVFLADFQNSTRSVIASELWKNFREYISGGLIQLIRAPSSFYPSSEINRHSFGKDGEYDQWRTKQNLDYAFIMKYAKGMSTYYMQMEDDIITYPGYVTSIYDFITSETEWICLEFSELGFIGKLYRNKHLGNLANLMIMFHSKQPVDFIFLYYNNMMTQYQRHIKRPTMFQHIGLHSSLSGKLQRLKDRFFDVMTKEYNGDNPPADIITSMPTYMSFIPKLAYQKTKSYFWSHGSPKAGDTFSVIFENPQILKRVVVITGSKYHPEDHVYNGRLDASLTLFKDKEGKMKCSNNIKLGVFTNGIVDVSHINEKDIFSVMCLIITFTKDQDPWLIVKEIAVFTK